MAGLLVAASMSLTRGYPWNTVLCSAEHSYWVSWNTVSCRLVSPDLADLGLMPAAEPVPGRVEIADGQPVVLFRREGATCPTAGCRRAAVVAVHEPLPHLDSLSTHAVLAGVPADGIGHVLGDLGGGDREEPGVQGGDSELDAGYF